jgi:hypothetical protein
VPATYRIDTEARIVYCRAWDVVTDGDVLATQAAMGTDPEFSKDFRQFFDLRDLVAMEITGAAMRKLASGNPFGRGSRRAFVVDRNSMFGLVRMFQSLTDEGEDDLQVFWSLEEALAWLNLNAAPCWP